MPLFNPAALKSLRALNIAALDSRAVIETPSAASVPGGGANTGRKGWTVVDGGDDVPCRLSAMDAAPVVIQAGQFTTPEHVLVVFDLEGPDVRQGDRITVSGTDIASQEWTRRVTVLSALSPRTNSAMRMFVCQDVSPAGG